MMINKEILLQVINDFEDEPNYKFSLKEYKSFLGPENKNMIFIVLQLEQYSYSTDSIHSKLADIKKRILNILSFDRVILNCDLKTDYF